MDTRPLADMLGDAPPEHDLRGRMIVVGIYGVAPWSVLRFADQGWGMWLAALVVGLPVLAVGAYFARAVNRFACWSWFFVGAVICLYLMMLVSACFPPDFRDPRTVTAAAAATMLLGALHYLWVRRWDFWSDARLTARRPPPRTVTPEWRAARLARMGTQAFRTRTVPPRPGALWRRRTSAVRR